VSFPGVDALRDERLAFLSTIESLTDEEFESGRTLCSAWAPRDVVAHVIGTADFAKYVRHGLRVNAVNAMTVADARALTRADLTARAGAWARQPTLSDQLAAYWLIGDVAVHHQDVLRGLGRTRKLPLRAAAAIFREGVVLSTGTSRNLLNHRVEPTTPGGYRLVVASSCAAPPRHSACGWPVATASTRTSSSRRRTRHRSSEISLRGAVSRATQRGANHSTGVVDLDSTP